MMHLDKKQLTFLKYISKIGKIYYKDLSDKQTKIANFLEENKLIDVSYQMKYDFETRKANYNPGRRMSATISETGKAYLSERKYEFRKMLFQDCFWPIAISVITNLLISGIKQLWPLIQQWLSNTL